MYRDDKEALHQRLEGTSREAERLRKENEAMRAAVGRMQLAPGSTLGLPQNAIYSFVDIRTLPLEERARLARHSLESFPVWLVGVLNVLTLGLFPLIHFSLLHNRLPKASHNDPGAARAFWFQLIPYYNLYWIFFNSLRLCDRLTLQLRLRSLPERAPRGLLIAACICTVIPYVNFFVGIPILWTIAVCMLQSTVNRIARLSPSDWDATVLTTANAAPALPNPGEPGLRDPGPVAYQPSMAVLQPSPEQLARQARARTLVNWSHLLGWGGLAMLVVGTSTAGALGGPTPAVVIGGISGVSVIVGAIIGQIGRGMQGRAI